MTIRRRLGSRSLAEGCLLSTSSLKSAMENSFLHSALLMTSMPHGIPGFLKVLERARRQTAALGNTGLGPLCTSLLEGSDTQPGQLLLLRRCPISPHLLHSFLTLVLGERVVDTRRGRLAPRTACERRRERHIQRHPDPKIRLTV